MIHCGDQYKEIGFPAFSCHVGWAFKMNLESWMSTESIQKSSNLLGYDDCKIIANTCLIKYAVTVAKQSILQDIKYV